MTAERIKFLKEAGAERQKFLTEYAENLANAKKVCAEMRRKQKEYLRLERAEFAAENKRILKRERP